MPENPARLFFAILVSGLLLLGFSACVHYQGEGTVGTIIATSEAFKAFDGEYENTRYFKNHKPASIAVLPFYSDEEKLFSAEDTQDQPEDIVRKGLYNHVSSLPFRDLEIADTDRRLINAGIRSSKTMLQLLADTPRQLKSILGVDAVITGHVTHFDKIYAGIYSQVAVGCEVKMWDLDSGKLLWRAKHVSRAHAGGISLNPIGLILSAAASAWNLRNTELLSQTDELFREITATIELPASMQATAKTKATIDLFTTLNAGKPVTAGKDLTFRIIGDPDCSAYVDLIDYKNAISLEPLAPPQKERLKSEIMASLVQRYEASGTSPSSTTLAELEKRLDAREIYEGSYTVSPGEERYGLTAKAYVVNAFGDQAVKLDPDHRIDIDAKPPAVVSGLDAESLDGKVRLHWFANRESDLSGYEIWISDSPLSGFEPRLTSETNHVYLQNLLNFVRLFAKIKAIDRAGNSGPFSSVVEAVPLPEPGLYDLAQPGSTLGGAMEASVLLVKGKSPYLVTSELFIKAGITLYMEPGVQLQFSPRAALIVTGGSVKAYGRKDMPVTMGPSAFEAEPGSWQGLILNRAQQTLLNHVQIEKAKTGITIMDSAPEIFEATIKNCSQAGLVLKQKAAPNITCSAFVSNHGQGGMVCEGAGIAPVLHHNIFRDNIPFAVQNYSPLEIDLSNNYWGLPVPNAAVFLGRVVWQPFLSAPSDACLQK
jgi:hypothetical protein